MRIAILGAECTGKTRLAQELVALLHDDFPTVAWEADDRSTAWQSQGRSPHISELSDTAHRHLARILRHPIQTLLLSDTAPLLTAVYCDVALGDFTLYQWAIDQHQAFALTLLTGMDLPWRPDRTSRQNAVMRTRIDQRLREVLIANRIGFSTVYGVGSARTQQARLSILSTTGRVPDTPRSNWKWICEKCSDAECEHRLFSALANGN